MLSSEILSIVGLALLALEFIALATAVHAVMNARTSQGATAWVIALITLPLVTLMLCAVFGRNKFQGYVDARRSEETEIQRITRQFKTRQADCARARFEHQGPAAIATQLAFLEDWYWATRTVPDLHWTPELLPNHNHVHSATS